MASPEQAPLAPKQESNPCKDGCATLGLDRVVGFTQKLWQDVSHKPFLGCAPLRQPGPKAWAVGVLRASDGCLQAEAPRRRVRDRAWLHSAPARSPSLSGAVGLV